MHTLTISVYYLEVCNLDQSMAMMPLKSGPREMPFSSFWRRPTVELLGDINSGIKVC